MCHDMGDLSLLSHVKVVTIAGNCLCLAGHPSFTTTMCAAPMLRCADPLRLAAGNRRPLHAAALPGLLRHNKPPAQQHGTGVPGEPEV